MRGRQWIEYAAEHRLTTVLTSRFKPVSRSLLSNVRPVDTSLRGYEQPGQVLAELSSNTRRGRSLGGVTPTRRVPRNGTVSIVGGSTRARRRRNVEKRRIIVFGSRSSQNRKQKYGENHANDFADPDFLFDFVYIRGSISTPCGRL